LGIVHGKPASREHETIWAIWFAYGKRHRDQFPALSLQRAAARQARPFGTRASARARTVMVAEAVERGSEIQAHFACSPRLA